MSTINFRKCAICGTICEANNDKFCGECGAPFVTSGINDTTPPLGGLQQSPLTPRVYDSSNYAPTQPQPFAPAQSSSRLQSNKVYFIVIAVLVLLLVSAAFFRLGLSLKGNAPTSNTPSGTNPPGTLLANSNTPATVTAPTPTPTPTPTPCPRPCVVYQENGSDNWQGWGLSDPWKFIPSQSLLINPGSSGDDSPSAIAPYNLNGGQNFAIEAKIRITGDNVRSIGLAACITTQGSWQGYRGGIYFDGFYISYYARISRTTDILSNVLFKPGTSWHIYRLEIRDNSISLFVDNAIIVQATDNTYLQCGNQIGLYDSFTTAQVSSFKVILL